MIERHQELVNNLQQHLEIDRILVSDACKDLIEVNKLFDLRVKLVSLLLIPFFIESKNAFKYFLTIKNIDFN